MYDSLTRLDIMWATIDWAVGTVSYIDIGDSYGEMRVVLVIRPIGH